MRRFKKSRQDLLVSIHVSIGNDSKKVDAFAPLLVTPPALALELSGLMSLFFGLSSCASPDHPLEVAGASVERQEIVVALPFAGRITATVGGFPAPPKRKVRKRARTVALTEKVCLDNSVSVEINTINAGGALHQLRTACAACTALEIGQDRRDPRLRALFRAVDGLKSVQKKGLGVDEEIEAIWEKGHGGVPATENEREEFYKTVKKIQIKEDRPNREITYEIPVKVTVRKVVPSKRA